MLKSETKKEKKGEKDEKITYGTNDDCDFVFMSRVRGTRKSRSGRRERDENSNICRRFVGIQLVARFGRRSGVYRRAG